MFNRFTNEVKELNVVIGSNSEKELNVVMIGISDSHRTL